MDWTVIRFWGKEILKNTDECIHVIEESIFENRMKFLDVIEQGYDDWLLGE